MRELSCPYRFDVRTDGVKELARCGLLYQILQGECGAHCDVDRSACEVCLASVCGAPARLNPVLPSLVYGACERLLGVRAPRERERWERLLAWAEQSLTCAEPIARISAACDVVLLAQGTAGELSRAVNSIVAQQDCQWVLHLLVDGPEPVLADDYRRHPQMRIHIRPPGESVYSALHNLLPQLATPYVALQDARTVSHPLRLASAVALLEDFGGEILGAPVQTPRRTLPAGQPGAHYDRYFPPEGLVIRRATLADMGGFADRPCDADAEFVFRAAAEGRALVRAPFPTVTWQVDPPPRALGPAPAYESGERALRGCARRQAWTNVEADVVLPFFGHLDFVDAALRSMVDQRQANVVVHLIDDASPDDTHALFNFWKSHRAVRLYRNAVNLGPFASFNNVIPCLETDLAAVQDADDVSLTERLYVAANVLRLSDADIFGSRTRVFSGAGDSMQPAPARYRSSQYPSAGCTFFMENPTAVMRKAAFTHVGGYADFGERRRNRTGIDTEFFARAHYAGCRFAISRDVTVLYRVHPQSASQHPLTGLQSPAHRESAAERDRRIGQFQQGRYDARSFGALHHFSGLTKRLT